jgi:hypothetical protein
LSYLAPTSLGQSSKAASADLTAQKLLAHSRLPLAWPEQRRSLGFA